MAFGVLEDGFDSIFLVKRLTLGAEVLGGAIKKHTRGLKKIA
jgi:hypothetical protein